MITPIISQKKKGIDAAGRPDRSAELKAQSTPRRIPIWKRCLDLGLIAISAPAWLPVMAVLGAMVKVLSPGPVLFRQERVGQGGARFVCLKFRTMRNGAATAGHEHYLAELIRSNRPMTKLDGRDPRLIPLAWILRSTGLDELPQLFNVLRGEMSLVGPRPCTPGEYASYSPLQRARSRATPGLTGLWQVSGKNSTTFDEMVDVDIRYQQTQCFWLDVGILLRTPAVLMGQLTDALLRRHGRTPSSARSLRLPAAADKATARQAVIPTKSASLNVGGSRMAPATHHQTKVSETAFRRRAGRRDVLERVRGS